MRKPGVIATVGDTGKVSVTAIVRDAAIVGNTPKGVRTDFFLWSERPFGGVPELEGTATTPFRECPGVGRGCYDSFRGCSEVWKELFLDVSIS